MQSSMYEKLEEISAAHKEEKAQREALQGKIQTHESAEVCLQNRIDEMEKQMEAKEARIKALEAENEALQKDRKAEKKIVEEYINAENYLKELIEEFKHGMKKIYEEEVTFKDLDEDEMTFCERFSNLLYNILLIIDFQKQFINN